MHSTLWEMRFIDELGYGIHSDVTTSRLELLKNYVRGLRYRERWDFIDKDKIIWYAREVLANESENIRESVKSRDCK